jgi:hypothetical protein
MADLNQQTRTADILEELRKLPEMLNVLSILTFIGSGLVILIDGWYFLSAKKIYDLGMAGQEKIDQAPAIIRNMQGSDPAGVLQRTFDNRVPIVILNIVACVLCIVGAVQMRKLKKTGYYIYLIGEILPLLILLLFVGTAALSGAFQIIGNTLFMILFLILYGTQIKYLKN